MRQIAALVVSIACIPAVSPIWAQTQTWIVIEEADGKGRGAFVPRSAPYTQGGPSVGVYLFDRQSVRTPDGQALTGFEFIGWAEGAATRVMVFALVPKEGEANTYMPNGDRKHLQRRDFASYLVSPGQSQSMFEMKALGIEPMILRAEVRDKRPE